MDLGQYLRDLLGASGAEALKRALAEGRTVIVTGVYGSGKSTVAATLRQFGYHAVEDFETYQIIRRDPADSLRMQRKSRPRGASAETAVKWNCQ